MRAVIIIGYLVLIVIADVIHSKLLADLTCALQMGLGKTLQSIALLAYLKSARSSKGPFCKLDLCSIQIQVFLLRIAE